MNQSFENKEKIVKDLLIWYEEHKRTLPWRSNPTPYHVWLSEIMLQQTRVEAVKAYYERFLQELPDIASLAAAKEDTLLKLWEGLGYYNRVRNMQTAAQTIMLQMDGEFPDRYETILTLKGIGEYTAGAIASIAFHEAVPAVDGNVLRVFSRLVGSRKDIGLLSTKKWVISEIASLLPIDQPGVFNQALMDLGAMVCIPNGRPHCSKCPWQEYCVSNRLEITDKIPVKQKKAARRKESKTVFLLVSEGKIAITKRQAKGLLAGMWQFPMAEKILSMEETKKQVECFLNPQSNSAMAADYMVKSASSGKHIFSHIEWQMKGRIVSLKEIPDNHSFLGQEIIWVTMQELETQYSVPSAFTIYRDLAEKLLSKNSEK